MMTTHAPLSSYREKITAVNAALKKLKKTRSLVGWARFACIVLAIGAFYYLLASSIGYAVLAALAFLAVFLRLVVVAADINQQINNLEQLRTINEDELAIAAGDFYAFPDGTEYLPEIHDYAYDLDIFGKASVYQYMNRTTSEQGGKMLADWLLSPAEGAIIAERQEAVKELAPQFEWRQQLQAYGKAEQIKRSTQHKLDSWISQENSSASGAHWKWLRFVLPGLICGALVLNITGLLPGPIFWGLVFIFFLISGGITKKIMPAYLQLDKIVSEINSLSNSLAHIEGHSFQSPLLVRLQSSYITRDGGASRQVKSLKGILDRLDIRLNPLLFIPLNTFLFWDLQQMLALEKWKETNKDSMLRWFDFLAAFESIGSLAGVHYNHPQWCFPEINTEDGCFTANELGHPLIEESKRVTSSFSTTGKPQIALITGSNMAGKSTFLRSVGINIVFAMMGAPVCARDCRVSVMRVVSSMRITDNLAESTSTFYAELKKLKYIITAVNNQEKVFLLLDEILRGTNSLDRHTGSHALINQLIRHKAAGMLATHDLELARLSEEHPAYIHNYHFDVQVENDELYFDYKLKEGVCQSLNASILMKKIGIEL